MMPIPREGNHTISSVEQICNFFSPMLWLDNVCEDVGMGFMLGGVFGTAFDFLKGMYDSSKGQRLSGGSKAVRKNGAFRFGPKVASHIAGFAVFRCLLQVPEDDIWEFAVGTAIIFGGIQYVFSFEIYSAARLALYGALLSSWRQLLPSWRELEQRKAKRKNH